MKRVFVTGFVGIVVIMLLLAGVGTEGSNLLLDLARSVADVFSNIISNIGGSGGAETVTPEVTVPNSGGNAPATD